MKKALLILLCLMISIQHLIAQKSRKPHRTLIVDSVMQIAGDSHTTENIPIVVLDETEVLGKAEQSIASINESSSDPFLSVSSNNFSAVRFRLRGYEANANVLFVNGSSLENIENGISTSSLLSGLNEVSRNKEVNLGLINNTFSFGGIGSSVQINIRSHLFKKHNAASYSFSNGLYAHKISFTHASGINKNGWSYLVSFSSRWSNKGYVAGTYINALNSLIGISKRFGLKHDLSLIAGNLISENGRQGYAVAEMDSLAGSHFYNPLWGYQNGKKRNANINKSKQLYFILTHDYKINNSTSLISSLAFVSTDHGATFLDWYNAADPRPDYYRYLPSYLTDPFQKQLLRQMMGSNEMFRQINWQHLYDANRASFETIANANGVAGNSISGKRSHYVLAENVSSVKRFNFNSTLNKTVGNHLQFTAGLSFQIQNNRIYKKANDLLGGDFFVDLNQFAERTYPSNAIANQNDLNRPNRIVFAGDQYGWDYNMISTKASAWLQTAFAFNHFDFFMATEIANTNFFRKGNVMSGLFPGNSFGKSLSLQFPGYSVKSGLTYKINGRNYVYANAALINKAPAAQDVFVSAKTRNEIQNNVHNEDIISAEAGYIFQSPQLKFRLSGYFTKVMHQLEVMNYYDDDLQNFVNYAIHDVSKVYQGFECGMDFKISEALQLKTAVSVGEYFYANRPEATVTIDNTASVAAKEILYLQHFNIGGMPQQAYAATMNYQVSDQFSLAVSGSYFANRWVDINPIRRTYRAIQNSIYGSDEWNSIIQQSKLANQFVLDISGNYFLQLSKRNSKNKRSLFFHAGINNLLNNKNIISGASEQMRFDFNTLNVNKFPPKYYYYYGLNFLLSANLRF